MIWNRMKKLSFKLTLAVMTFFIGVGIVSLWYFSRTESMSDEALSDIVLNTKFVVESPCDYPQPQNREIDAQEAVYLAECFVIQNGYTDLPPTDDKSKIVPDIVWGLPDEKDIKMRHDTLKRAAYSVERSESSYGGSWIVMFRYKQHTELVARYGKEGFEKMGAAIVMDFEGKNVRMQHTSKPLNMPQARVLNR